MQIDRKTVEMALSALEENVCSSVQDMEAVTALRNALDAEKPAEVEIVAWMFTDSWGTHFTEDKRDWYDTVGIESVTPLYTTPPDAAAQIEKWRLLALEGTEWQKKYQEQIAQLEAKLDIASEVLEAIALKHWKKWKTLND